MKNTLKNKKEISNLFENGKSISNGMFLLKYLKSENNGVLFAVSSKKFKKAVDRNRIKRLMRESIRNKNIDKTLAIIYIGNNIPSFIDVEKSICDILKKL